MVKRYEAVFILTPVLSESQVKEAVKNYKSYLKKVKAKLVYESHWGLKKLAYPIQKKTTGFYHLFEVTVQDEASENFISDLELKFNRDEKVMRFLCVKMDKHAIAFAESHRNPQPQNT